MDQTLSLILTQGLTPPLLLALIKLLIIAFIGLAINNWMTNQVKTRLAYRRLAKNKYLRDDSWIEIPTATGSYLARIVRITPSKVVARSDELHKWVHIPILQFEGSQLVLPDTAPTKDAPEVDL